MNKKYSDVTILCRVVDNYGDIGFVYRLSRSLSELSPELKLRLVVSNLESFASMAHGLDPNKAVQEYRSWTVLDWNADDACRAEYTKNPPSLILECFQCSRPEWLDDILFAPGRTDEVQIINIEYLTAEDWADDVHLLKSGTRSALVKKVNFMPGFTEKTGGLVIDSEFASSLRDKNAALLRLKDYPEYPEIEQAVCAVDVFCVSLFTYKRDLSP
ncbi:MAG: elongation factor P maturation arginine rhamnosyltransferase EarP, partial [Treponema sp.]|nr:elongation factor P maturation arginine rhamnosyltransferase EarP [Treponema sp.]